MIEENSINYNQHTQIYLNYIVNNLPHYIFWKDANCTFLGCNQLFAKSAGLVSAVEIIGKTDYDMPWYRQAEKFIADDNEVIKRGISKLNYEEKQIHDNGNEAIMLVSKVPMYDADSKIIGVLGIYTDITERKRMEENLWKSKQQAEAANQLKSEFIRNMEHDIRTPFSGIYSLAQALETTETEPNRKEYLNAIWACAKQLLDYCNNIIEFSKIEAGTLPVVAKKIVLEELINDIISMERAAAIAKGLDFTVEYDKNLPDIVLGDPYRMKAILINLVSNAIKFTRKGYVKLSAKLAKQLDDRCVVIQLIVEDSGIGIPSDKCELVYEKFRRLIPANKGLYRGLGLGLAIVKQFIKELDAEIDVQSQLDKGSKFICTIPLNLPLG